MSERAVHELLSDVSWAIAQRLPKRDLLAMLARLVASAKPGSAEERFAKLELARFIDEMSSNFSAPSEAASKPNGYDQLGLEEDQQDLELLQEQEEIDLRQPGEVAPLRIAGE